MGECDSVGMRNEELNVIGNVENEVFGFKSYTA